MNATELSEKENVSVSCIAKRWEKEFPSVKFSRYSELTEEEVSFLRKEKKNGGNGIAIKNKEVPVSGKREIVKPLSNPVVSKGVPPVKKKIDVRAIRSGVIDLLLCAIVAGHAILIWYDCSVLWGVAGLIGGGLSFLVVLAALLLSTDDLKPRTSETAIWFIFLVDGLAWKAHYDVFVKAATTSEMVTGVICAFFCACSFVALYLFRDSKLS